MENHPKKKHIITIVGRPGSGKSTASKSVAAKLGYRHFSAGNLLRKLGKERGIDILQANLAAETDDILDFTLDQKLRDIGESESNIVIDSRLAAHWIPTSFKVFLDLDLETAAKRILKNQDPKRLEHEHIPDDPKKYAKILQRRLDIEIRRYKTRYDANPYDTKKYDLVIDTKTTNQDQVAEQIIQAYKDWLR